ncbi:unnamed protein product, partial [marine sediment metagenome]
MSFITNITGYKTSKDYERLYELAQLQSVVCITDYSDNLRDICQTLYHDGITELSARGTSYVYARSLDGFVKQCQKNNVEW